MAADIIEFFPAVDLFKNNQLARDAFKAVTAELGISGYGIARKLNKKPAEIEVALSSLRDRHLISGSAGLGENLTLTGAGFGFKQFIAKHPELWSEDVGV